jgi:hypothetical protein
MFKDVHYGGDFAGVCGALQAALYYLLTALDRPPRFAESRGY